MDRVGNLAYVTEELTGELSRVNLSTGTVTVVATNLGAPIELALAADGVTAYVVSDGQPDLLRVDLSTGATTALMFGFSGPRGIDLGRPPSLSLSLSDGVQAFPATSISVPVSVGDVYNWGVLSADFTVEWNDAVLTATSVTPGALAAGCTVTGNLTTPGRAVISVFCTTFLSGAGSLAQINFNLTGQGGQGTPLRLVSGMLNEGSPALCLDSGSVEIPAAVSGRLTYYRDAATGTEPSSSGVPGGTVRLQDFSTGAEPSALRACDGTYFFPAVAAGHIYRMLAGKTADFGGAIDPFDASRNAQGVVGLISLTPNQRLAAEVTGNGTLSSLDSARIAQFSVGLITRFPVADFVQSDWVFAPTPQSEPNQAVIPPMPGVAVPGWIEYNPLDESAENQDFRAILFGDVSGNWTPPACLAGPGGEPGSAESLATSSGAATVKASARLALPDLVTHPGGTVQAPVTVTGGAGAISFYLDITWNQAILRLKGATAGSSGSGFSITANGNEPGRARVALYGTTPLSVDREVVVLTFEVVGKAGSRSPLRLTAASVNEGGLAAEVVDGSVLITPGRPRR